MSKSRKRNKGFTTKNTHIPKRVTDFVNRVQRKVEKFDDGDIAVLETQLLTTSDDDLWNEFTHMLSEGMYLPILEDFRKGCLSDKPHLDKPITNIECMLLGVTLMGNGGGELKKDYIRFFRGGREMIPSVMGLTLKLISDIREITPMNQIQSLEKKVDWE